MGNCCSLVRLRRRPSAVNPKNVTLLLVGLDNAGKTTISKRLLKEPLDGVVPTVGFSRISLEEKNCRVTIYDLGGGPQIRDIWPRYYPDVHGVIFVIDASAINRMGECRKVLEGLLLDGYISGKPVLLLANKQDLEGALDEIDVVDRLNVERLVNKQKCPTLVELCSAQHFSRKMDAGIENGYKWLLRCVVKDYPLLNNRVLKDLATQEELERIKKIQRIENIKRIREERENDGFNEANEPNHVSSTVEKQMNGTVQMIDSASIPGQIDECLPGSSPGKDWRSPTGDGHRSYPAHSVSYSCEFFKYEKDNPDIMLINNMDEKRSLKNFLVRPKSSGPKMGSEGPKRKTPRRKSYHRHNKTAPSPVTDVILEPIDALPKVFGVSNRSETKEEPGRRREDDAGKENRPEEPAPRGRTNENASKSVPGSREASANALGRRCLSGDNVTFSKIRKLPPVKLRKELTERELILDVTSLED